MIKSGTVVAGPHTRIEFERTSADTGGALLRFEETYQVGPQHPPMHIHATQTERFTVLRGTLGVRVGRETRVLGPGEVAEVPPGTPHTLWNAGDQPCVHRVEMMPALAMEDFFHEVVTIEAEGGMPPRSLAHAGRLATLSLRHHNQLSALPWSIQRALFGLVAFLSRWLSSSRAVRPASPPASSTAPEGTVTTTYRAVMVKGKGGLEQLETVELPLAEPGAGEVRVKIRAAGAGFTDISMRTGYSPYRPPFPFVQGYELVGDVDAVGAGIARLRKGQRVAALTVHGGYAEYIVRGADDFVPVPEGLDDGEAVALILNYVTAYQMIHRTAKMVAGQTALVTGANGGVGTALLELLRVHGVKAVGATSPRHFDLVESLGGEPIASRAAPLDALVRALHPDGVDAAFDGLGGRGTGECIRATKKGGIVVSYGVMATLEGGNLSTLRGLASLFVGARFAGRRSSFYGITRSYREDKRPLQEDLPRLFALLAARTIEPRIAARLPLLAAREAQERLLRGGVTGKIVHLAEPLCPATTCSDSRRNS